MLAARWNVRGGYYFRYFRYSQLTRVYSRLTPVISFTLYPTYLILRDSHLILFLALARVHLEACDNQKDSKVKP